MEGLIFLADIVCMLLLCVAVVRSERKDSSEDLGLFSFKLDQKARNGADMEGKHDA
jgi:hypothetical protein